MKRSEDRGRGDGRCGPCSGTGEMKRRRRRRRRRKEVYDHRVVDEPERR